MEMLMVVNVIMIAFGFIMMIQKEHQLANIWFASSIIVVAIYTATARILEAISNLPQ